jgi:PAP2 superfamily protein
MVRLMRAGVRSLSSLLCLTALGLPALAAVADDPAPGSPDQPESRPLLQSAADVHVSPSRSDAADFRATAREILSRFTHPSRKEAFAYAGLALGALYLEQHKFGLARDVQQQRTDDTNVVAGRFRPLGEAIVPLAAVSTYFIGRMSGSERTHRAGLILSESAVFTFAATELGQFVFAEQRPLEGGKLRFFTTGGHGISGHTSIIASMAVPLDRLFFRIQPDDGAWTKVGKFIGKGVVYGAPLMTGWSRMNDDKHFAWNVLLGLGVGYTMGEYVSSAHGLGRGRDDEPSRSDWRIVPITGERGGAGLALAWSH